MRQARSEITVYNSRFICSVFPSSSVEEAKANILQVKNEFYDASHHVPAYIIGHGTSVIEHCNDDGEPSGTAGKPVLSVIKGSGFGDITVVVTRYFGGTKLGTGGLVRAYSDATKSTLSITKKGVKRLMNNVKINTPYQLYQTIMNQIISMNGIITNKIFSDLVVIEAQIQSGDFQVFLKKLYDISRGKITIELVSQIYITIAI